HHGVVPPARRARTLVGRPGLQPFRRRKGGKSTHRTKRVSRIIGCLMRRLGFALWLIFALAASAVPAQAQEKWVTAWAASVQGPYPVGNPSAQPDLRLVFPSPETGARDQTFRLIVTPDIWGRQARLRLSNAFGTRPITFDGVRVGLQLA